MLHYITVFLGEINKNKILNIKVLKMWKVDTLDPLKNDFQVMKILVQIFTHFQTLDQMFELIFKTNYVFIILLHCSYISDRASEL